MFNRRQLLKAAAGLPFVGGMLAASESQPCRVSQPASICDLPQSTAILSSAGCNSLEGSQDSCVVTISGLNMRFRLQGVQWRYWQGLVTVYGHDNEELYHIADRPYGLLYCNAVYREDGRVIGYGVADRLGDVTLPYAIIADNPLQPVFNNAVLMRCSSVDTHLLLGCQFLFTSLEIEGRPWRFPVAGTVYSPV